MSPSAVTALVAARELQREIGGTVIHNLITSRAVPELVTERGGTPVRSCVGHSYIKALMADTGAIFGGEHSAHYYFRDFWGADSGMLAALHVLAALGEQHRPLSELMADYQRYEPSGEINFAVADGQACIEAVLKSLGTRIVSIDHLDGVTVDLGEGSLVQHPDVQHRAAAAAQCRGPDKGDGRRDRREGSSRNHFARGRFHMNATRSAIDLDDADGLVAADREGLLRAASTAGAHVRAIAAAVEEGELESLAGPLPRSVIWVAGRGTAATAGRMVVGAARAGRGAPIVVTPGAPPWIGPLDALWWPATTPAIRRLSRRRVGRAARGAGARGCAVRGPAARCRRRAGGGAGPAATGDRRVRPDPVSGRRAGRRCGRRRFRCGWTSPRWPTKSTRKCCATARCAKCSQTRPRRSRDACRRAGWCWAADSAAPWRWPSTAARVLLRIAGVVAAAAGLADVVVALRADSPGAGHRFRGRAVSRRTDRRAAAGAAAGAGVDAGRRAAGGGGPGRPGSTTSTWSAPKTCRRSAVGRWRYRHAPTSSSWRCWPSGWRWRPCTCDWFGD